MYPCAGDVKMGKFDYFVQYFDENDRLISFSIEPSLIRAVYNAGYTLWLVMHNRTVASAYKNRMGELDNLPYGCFRAERTKTNVWTYTYSDGHKETTINHSYRAIWSC